MPFIRMEGFEGLVYVPEDDGRCCRKHDCKDCFSCQMCIDERCAICLKKKKRPEKALKEKACGENGVSD